MTEQTLKKGMELNEKIREAEKTLNKIVSYEEEEQTGQFVLDNCYRISVPIETAKKIAMLIKIETTTQLEQLKKEFEQLGKE